MVKVQNGAGGGPIQLLANLGANSSSVLDDRISLTLTTGVAAGNTVIVAAGQSLNTLQSVSDNRGNTYSIDLATVVNGDARVAIASARITTALQSGDTITAVFGGHSYDVRALSAAAFSGLTATTPRADVTATGTGTSSTPATAASTATQYPSELVIGAVAAASTTSFSPGSGFSGLSSGSGNSGNKQLAIHLEYKLVSTTGAQSAGGTLGSSAAWAAGLVSYKPADTTAPSGGGAPTGTVTPGTVTLAWTAATDASGIGRYSVHRGTADGFSPTAANRIGYTTQLSYTDSKLATGTYYYVVVAEDTWGNVGSSSYHSAAFPVTADPGLPDATLTGPADGTTVAGTITLTATATDPGGNTTLSYGFDPSGFRNSRTLNSVTTRYLLGGLIETNATGTITRFDIDGPLGDLAHYTAPPTPGQTSVSLLYYNAHGDVAAETNLTGSRTAAYTYDPFGAAFDSTPTNTTTERWTGQWDKKHDTTTGLIEMGARPYDPALGRFLSVDPIDGGSANEYDYALQNPINAYDLDGMAAAGSGLVYGDGGPPCIWGSCRQYLAPPPPGPLQGALAKVASHVATYGGSCVWGATTAGLASGGTGVILGCATGVGFKYLSKRGGKVATYSSWVENTLLFIEVRRMAYKRLGVPTYREIVRIYRAGARGGP